MTDECNSNDETERACPPQITEEEAAAVYGNNRKYDPAYSFDGLHKLQTWMEDTLSAYHLLVHAVNGEVALRWNEIDQDIDVLVTDEGREKIADRLLESPDLTEEQQADLEKQVGKELGDILKNINFNDTDVTKLD